MLIRFDNDCYLRKMVMRSLGATFFDTWRKQSCDYVSDEKRTFFKLS